MTYRGPDFDRFKILFTPVLRILRKYRPLDNDEIARICKVTLKTAEKWEKTGVAYPNKIFDLLYPFCDNESILGELMGDNEIRDLIYLYSEVTTDHFYRDPDDFYTLPKEIKYFEDNTSSLFFLLRTHYPDDVEKIAKFSGLKWLTIKFCLEDGLKTRAHNLDTILKVIFSYSRFDFGLFMADEKIRNMFLIYNRFSSKVLERLLIIRKNKRGISFKDAVCFLGTRKVA